MASVNYNGITVSDKPLRITLQSIADSLGTNLSITSGDRNVALSMGGKKRSLHLKHQAADFHASGLSDAQVFAQLKAQMNNIFDHSQAYEVIHHGPYTETTGPHIHVGRYGDGRSPAVYFKKEGLTPATKGDYRTGIEVKGFSNSKGVSVPPSIVKGITVNSQILSPTIGVSQSVGEGGVNMPTDVALVQHLLNAARKNLISAGISFQNFQPLMVDNDCGPRTKQAILIFQRDVMRVSNPDGRVDPGGKTIHALYVAAYSSPEKIRHRIHRVKTSPAIHKKNGGSSRENYATASQLVNDPKIRAMLDTIIFAEGTGKYGAGTICYGIVIRSPYHPEYIGKDTRTFAITDFSRHPAIQVRVNPSLTSDAAGKYQFMGRTWAGLRGVPDFTERSQDVAAVMLMQRRGMIDPLLNGDLTTAIHRAAPEWASFPTVGGGSYCPGGRARYLASLVDVYNKALAKYK
ncbi:MAG: D-Ala-D-Ala carboxypeptidase family metallohydrolase [Pyrinomonadaceae bacterium]